MASNGKRPLFRPKIGQLRVARNVGCYHARGRIGGEIRILRGELDDYKPTTANVKLAYRAGNAAQLA